MRGDNTPAIITNPSGGGGGTGGNGSLGTTGAWRFLEMVSSSDASLVLQHRRANGTWVTVHVYQDTA